MCPRHRIVLLLFACVLQALGLLLCVDIWCVLNAAVAASGWCVQSWCRTASHLVSHSIALGIVWLEQVNAHEHEDPAPFIETLL